MASKRAIRPKLVYTCTAGHSGTNFLAYLLRANLPEGRAKVYHERNVFGTLVPDLGMRMKYNSLGNTVDIRDWWKGRMKYMEAEVFGGGLQWYVETDHTPWISGLLENVLHYDQYDQYYIFLYRDPLKIIKSLHRRADMFNVADMALWWLKPEYELNHVDFNFFHSLAPEIPELPGKVKISYSYRLWYPFEILARQQFVRENLRKLPHVGTYDINVDQLNDAKEVAALLRWMGHTVEPDDVTIPEPTNVTEVDLMPYTDEDDRWYRENIEKVKEVMGLDETRKTD